MIQEEMDIKTTAIYADIDKVNIEEFKAIFSKKGGVLWEYIVEMI